MWVVTVYIKALSQPCWCTLFVGSLSSSRIHPTLPAGTLVHCADKFALILQNYNYWCRASSARNALSYAVSTVPWTNVLTAAALWDDSLAPTAADLCNAAKAGI